MTDYKLVAAYLEGFTESYPDKTGNIAAAVALCVAAAKATAEIDPDEERAHCANKVRSWVGAAYEYQSVIANKLAREREEARTQAVLAAHNAYRELTDALAEFFYSHDPSDLKRVERAFDKTRDL